MNNEETQKKGPEDTSQSSSHGTSEKKMETIGTYLKELRSKKKKSLKNIAHHTKVSIHILESLEEEDFTQLPQRTYCRGFVRSYVKSLNGNVDEALEIFDFTYNSKSPNPEVTFRDVLRKNPEAEKEKNQKITFFILGVLAVILIAFLYSRSSDETTPPIDPAPIDKIKEILPEQQSEQRPEEQEEEKDTKELKKESPLETTQDTKDTKDKETQTIAPDQKPPQIEVNPRPFPPTPIFTINPNLNHRELANRYIPSGQQNIDTNQANVFVFAEEGESWITFKVDDGEIRRVVLPQGRSLKLEGEVIRMFVGNLNALKIFYQNQLIESASTTGVRSFVFPEEMKKNFTIPLFVFPGDGTTWTTEEYLQNFSD